MSADVHTRLSDDLLALFAPATLKTSRQRDWASATFSGARHFYTLRIEGRPGLEPHELAGREFAIPGHLVADICIVEQRDIGEVCEVWIEALTVEEA